MSHRALQRDDGATRGFTGFQIAVGLGNVGQLVGLVDANVHLAARHHIKQLVGHFLGALTGGDVREQRLTRHIQRTFGAQNARRKWRHRA